MLKLKPHSIEMESFLIFLRVLFLSLATLSSININAQNEVQSLSRETQIKARFYALRAVDEYRLNCALYDEEEYERFRELFRTRSKILNDILPANQLDEKVGIDQYYDYMIQFHREPVNVDIEPYNLSIDEDYNVNGTLLVFVNARKHITAYSQNQIFRDTLDLKFSVLVNPSSGSAEIKEIGANRYYGKYIRVQLDEHQWHRFQDSVNLLVNDKKYKLLNDSTLILKKIKSDTTLIIKSPSDKFFQSKKLRIIKDSLGFYGDYRGKEVNLHFRPKRLYTLFNYQYLLSNQEQFVDNQGYSSRFSFNGSSIGVNLGIIIGSTKDYSFNISFLAGVDIITSTYRVAYDSLFTQSPNQIDNSGSEFTMLVRSTDFVENGSLVEYRIPISLRFEFRLSERFYLSLSPIVGFQQARTSDYEVSTTNLYSGLYDFGGDIDPIEMNDQSLSDFGEHTISSTNASGAINSWNIFYGGSLGLSVKLNQRHYLELAFYSTQFNSAFFQDTGVTFSSSKDRQERASAYQNRKFQLNSISIGLKSYL